MARSRSFAFTARELPGPFLPDILMFLPFTEI
jgi:hypothetical protein